MIRVTGFIRSVLTLAECGQNIISGWDTGLRIFRNIAIVTILLLLSTPASAIELGSIDVNSRLGEPFTAKVPFTLNEGEMVSSLTVELATLNDYQTLHVHYHPVLRLIRTDIVRNRLSNWIELSSRSPIKAPVFSLVLKMRYGNAIHFKKYSVFLDVAGTKPSSKRPAPPPAISVKDVKKDSAATTYLSLDAPLLTEERVSEEKIVVKPATRVTTFKPFAGWARTSSYGPIIYGDTLFTIADRLRMDERYTIRQVMVALFEKNRSMFAEDNLNLPITGTYLQAPLAEEVERHSYEQALSIIQDHNRRWKELKKQPRYAAVAEAQRNRYNSKRAIAKSTATSNR